MELFDLADNLIVYVAIIVLLSLTAIVLMVRELVIKRMSDQGKYSFYILVVPIMLVMIPQFGKGVSMDLWMFGGLLGTFVGATFFSTSFKLKDAKFIPIYGILGVIIGFACNYFKI